MYCYDILIFLYFGMYVRMCIRLCVYVCMYLRARKYMYDRCGYKRMRKKKKKKKKKRKMRVCLKCKYVFAGNRD